ncbi:methylmalonyl-CoA mutase family protein [Streptomyces sp. NPDC048639]|uniref:methylmalonyl-CoA mutase family protein n=1 Tax=Streptomyces sp. NPDC048639 TaxID=3365581 RepID=UPI00371F93D7
MTVLPDDGLSLAAEFPDAPRKQWQSLVEGVLRKSGADVSDTAAEDTLSTELEDGLTTRPLYTAEDGPGDPGYPGFPPFLRGGGAAGTAVSGWDVRQRHTHPDAKRSNEALLGDLENGVTSVWLTVGGAGVPVAELPEALDGVYLDLAPVVLEPGADFEPAARELFRLYDERGVAPQAALGHLGADPLGLFARTGEDEDLARRSAAAAALAGRCDHNYPGVRALVADALPYHEAGASPAEELGCSLATGVAYLRDMTEAGLSADAACGQLEFRYAATADQFLTIAKFRAARRLWGRVAEVCGVSPAAAAQRQHAVTSPVMMTRRDPWVNMLRTTVATLGAGVGGADAVTVLPFDSALGLPDALARRIARNTSSILLEESRLAQVIDPAGGSWYVERLTDELARAAWSWFQRIERAGGQAAALRAGVIAERIGTTWQRRSEDLAHRREPVTGVSEFPFLAERPVEREPAPARPSGGLPVVRRDEAYEVLRARSDAHLTATGARPKVFLANLGSPAAYTARSTFAANLFQAGGIEPVPAEDGRPLAESFAASGARAVCLCSSDAVYAERAEQVAAELTAAGATRIQLAGRPGEKRSAYEAAGIGTFLYAGADAVAALTAALDDMGVA